MPRYKLRFLKGPNYTLELCHEEIVEAASFEEALAPRSDWPITESYDHATATAWNPGTCMYYQELWEAERLFDSPDADRSALSPAADARIKKTGTRPDNPTGSGPADRPPRD